MNRQQLIAFVAQAREAARRMRASIEIRRQFVLRIARALGAATHYDPRLRGITVASVLGPEVMARIAAADVAAERFERIMRQLDRGVLVFVVDPATGRLGVIPRAVLASVPGAGVLEGWGIAVGVVALIAVLIAALLIADWVTDVQTQEALNNQIVAEAQFKATQMIGGLAQQNPQAAEAAINALRGFVQTPAGQQPPGGSSSGWPLGLALGGGAAIILAIIAFMWSRGRGGGGRRRNPRRSRRLLPA